MKSQLAEVQTGFEPLFFHIQADFQWQRPFSEGCGGWISEKSGMQNLIFRTFMEIKKRNSSKTPEFLNHGGAAQI